MTGAAGGGGDAARRPGAADGGLVLTGRVEDACAADLLGSLGRSRDTGLLTLSREGVRKTVYVQEGRIVFAASNDRDDRLGETLLREGMITVEQYDESGRLIRPGKRQGTILVEMGYITPAELVKGVKLQVESIALSLFQWRTGEYRIEMREFDTRDIITLNISTENLVFTGVQQGAGWSQVLRGLGGTLDTVLERTPDADARLYKIDLSDDGARTYAHVNGKATVAQICAMSYVSDFSTCVTLYALACCGLLAPVAVRDAETLFREQVAEFERAEVRDAVAAFDAGLGALRAALGPDAAARLAEVLDRACREVLDEHWDALREVDLATGRIDPALVLENVDDVEPGRRRALVQRALAALADAIVGRARAEMGESAAGAAASALAAARAEGRQP